YMALSHCWGNGQSITTTTGNLSNHQTSIQKKLLSKTFREAIDITLQLGIRYLWIDSLCIIQDSLEDWTSESARMSEVYSNAFATVFAVKASDGSQGCFANRNAMMNPGASGPLYGRAWVYQEELLSRRSIAFAANGVYWAYKQQLLHDPWYHVVSYYSQRALTVPTDRLPALSALASILHSHAREDRYLAGIWQHDLPRGLLWTCSSGSIDHGLQAGPYVAPSWSW
ncbi:heterokaryon incompatibility protein-domain-containing protein, partial [Leptodontidium sp. 2 PMI_412]